MGKVRLKAQPFKKEKAWQIVPAGIQTLIYWVPFSAIGGYNPATLVIKIEIWWLEKNNIKFSL